MMSQPKTLEDRLREKVLLDPDHELHQESVKLLAEIEAALEEARVKAQEVSDRNNQEG
jgi:F0F1-type ATP synthase membrane subunit b/b'